MRLLLLLFLICLVCPECSSYGPIATEEAFPIPVQVIRAPEQPEKVFLWPIHDVFFLERKVTRPRIDEFPEISIHDEGFQEVSKDEIKSEPDKKKNPDSAQQKRLKFISNGELNDKPIVKIRSTSGKAGFAYKDIYEEDFSDDEIDWESIADPLFYNPNIERSPRHLGQWFHEVHKDTEGEIEEADYQWWRQRIPAEESDSDDGQETYDDEDDDPSDYIMWAVANPPWMEIVNEYYDQRLKNDEESFGRFSPIPRNFHPVFMEGLGKFVSSIDQTDRLINYLTHASMRRRPLTTGKIMGLCHRLIPSERLDFCFLNEKCLRGFLWSTSRMGLKKIPLEWNINLWVESLKDRLFLVLQEYETLLFLMPITFWKLMMTVTGMDIETNWPDPWQDEQERNDIINTKFINLKWRHKIKSTSGGCHLDEDSTASSTELESSPTVVKIYSKARKRMDELNVDLAAFNSKPLPIPRQSFKTSYIYNELRNMEYVGHGYETESENESETEEAFMFTAMSHPFRLLRISIRPRAITYLTGRVLSTLDGRFLSNLRDFDANTLGKRSRLISREALAIFHGQLSPENLRWFNASQVRALGEKLEDQAHRCSSMPLLSIKSSLWPHLAPNCIVSFMIAFLDEDGPPLELGERWNYIRKDLIAILSRSVFSDIDIARSLHPADVAFMPLETLQAILKSEGSIQALSLANLSFINAIFSRESANVPDNILSFCNADCIKRLFVCIDGALCDIDKGWSRCKGNGCVHGIRIVEFLPGNRDAISASISSEIGDEDDHACTTIISFEILALDLPTLLANMSNSCRASLTFEIPKNLALSNRTVAQSADDWSFLSEVSIDKLQTLSHSKLTEKEVSALSKNPEFCLKLLPHQFFQLSGAVLKAIEAPCFCLLPFLPVIPGHVTKAMADEIFSCISLDVWLEANYSIITHVNSAQFAHLHKELWGEVTEEAFPMLRQNISKITPQQFINIPINILQMIEGPQFSLIPADALRLVQEEVLVNLIAVDFASYLTISQGELIAADVNDLVAKQTALSILIEMGAAKMKIEALEVVDFRLRMLKISAMKRELSTRDMPNTKGNKFASVHVFKPHISGGNPFRPSVFIIENGARWISTTLLALCGIFIFACLIYLRNHNK